jgi:hypothetical protein
MKKSVIILTGLIVCLLVCVLTYNTLAAESKKLVLNPSLSPPAQAAHVTTDASRGAKSNDQVQPPPVRLQVKPQSMKGTFLPAIRVPQDDAQKAQKLQETAQHLQKHYTEGGTRCSGCPK